MGTHLNKAGNEIKKLFYIKVGENIKAARIDRRMTLRGLAEKCGVSFKMIHKYEKGEVRIDMDRIRTIAKALDVELEVLFEGTESISAPDKNDGIDIVDFIVKNNIPLFLDGKELNDKQRQLIIEFLRSIVNKLD